MKKSTKIWILIIGIAIVILGLMAWYKAKNTTRGLEVNIEQVARRSITQIVSASGKIYPEKEVKISSDVSGEIIELYVAEGDSVVQGKLLLKINPDAYMSAVDRGKALLNDAKAQYAMSLSNVESSKAQKSQILANLENTRNIHERNKSLYKDGIISKAEWEKSTAALHALEANLASANANINASKRSAEASSYRIKSAEASLKELKTNLSRTTISAPVSGIVSKLNVESGERVVGTIQMTGTEIMRIANLSNMEVQVEVSENDIVNVTLGDEADIEVDAYLGKTFIGYVTEIAHSAANAGSTAALNSNQVTNFIVKIRVDQDSYADLISSNKKYPFRPGMSATVEIKTEQIDSALSIPIQSVTTRDKKKDNDEKGDDTLLEVVFVVHGDTVSQTEVVTGIQDDEYIHIIKGLTEEDKVVTGPYSMVSKKLSSGKNVQEKKKKSKRDNEEAD